MGHEGYNTYLRCGFADFVDLLYCDEKRRSLKWLALAIGETWIVARAKVAVSERLVRHSEASSLLPGLLETLKTPSFFESTHSNNTPSSTTQTHTAATVSTPTIKMAANTTPLTLDYTMCTPSELRGFIRNRKSLSAAESDALRNYQKSYLVGCLEALDRSATFRFGDLLPEVRLEIYRHVLVGRDRENLHAPDRAIETAILRTCKAVYAEAEPVLYSDNDFAVAVNVSSEQNTWDNGGDPSTCNHFHYTAIFRPGPSPCYKFSQDDFADQYPTLSDHTASSSSLDMLRRVRHLEILIGDCTLTTQEVIASLCMTLSGTIPMKTLIVVLQPSHASIDEKELAKIFWPLAFVHTDVEFACFTQDVATREEMEEALGGMYNESLAYRIPMQAYPHPGLESPGDLIAKARARAAHLVKQHGKDWRYLRNTDLMVSELVRCIGEIGDINQVHAFAWAWQNLASYVHESDRELQMLEQMARDARCLPRTFPSRYAAFRGRGARAGELSKEVRLEIYFRAAAGFQ